MKYLERLSKQLHKYIGYDDVTLSKAEFLVMVRDRINSDLEAMKADRLHEERGREHAEMEGRLRK